MDNKREKRKHEHIARALEQRNDVRSSGWEDVQLVHQALAHTSLGKLDTGTIIWGKKLAFPLIINALTGGAPGLETINEALARTAARYGLGLAVGSQTAAVQNKDVRSTFQVAREVYPEGLILANVSASVEPDTAAEAVAMIQADALQLHLNSAQELLMLEGDRDFAGLLENIRRIRETVPVPVMVKEVGFGMSRETAHRLVETGIQAIDTGGAGGTNFAGIELARYPRKDMEFLEHWGLPSAVSLLETASLRDSIIIMASGGISGALEMMKALALGADLVGIAGPFLKILLQEGHESLERRIGSLIESFRIIMMLTGAENLEQVKGLPVVVTGYVREWCDQRGLDTSKLARRGD